MTLVPLPRPVIEPALRTALEEDLGLAGDITSAVVIPDGHRSIVTAVARKPGVIAGLDCAELACALVDPAIEVTRHLQDGAPVTPGARIATFEGPSRSLLTAERTALNFMGHLSGIASVTAGLVQAVAGTQANIVCTRKTTPGLRALEKYAVRAGGGMNHRYSLADAVLIKDNHIAIAGGIRPALEAARAATGHMVKIEIEVDTLDQLREVLEIGADAVLLDNMDPDTLRKAVEMVAGRAITEASGGITPDTAATVAASGVDLISLGWITHSAPTLDIGLDFVSVAES
ncbi:carboxylating nicotinate-nucleotide diphosphorylase [Mameliella alba]|uniref:carboxylating nicotinate-nucleotide diphosphorylase n=1 Tax=Mameliella alba TaxID=561184 RepID=UPI000883193C|nr:carboxylating nicotinate-nucleotide diphosphorylase [Mameliella alba]MBV6637495.1 carboxylating nicotinate-nucleotide diphosphorylase [Mameliella sp.]MBY6122540.1 carboxylating nicotinate-nucleotide diphosphorylase [Mameliella alba]OWV39348.1 nicotinate-nucleotide diphosphorylase (carboxylating) [Mameliella alba]OWV41189.1 nicotinate-nucleotide diphosphorylase (carboxylating) [Mameliella alba]OWV52743.1 nicotinate-nucleotide diphosphorylase (carboxylating) [Mameliella alba]